MPYKSSFTSRCINQLVRVHRGATAAEPAKCDVLLTVDRGFEYQQNLGHRKIAVIIFCGKSVLLEDLVPLMPACLARLESIKPGQVIRIESSGSEARS
jgi:hypothetical protein